MKIFGATGNIGDTDDFLLRVVDFSVEHDIVIQVFNADLIYGRKRHTYQ